MGIVTLRFRNWCRWIRLTCLRLILKFCSVRRLRLVRFLIRNRLRMLRGLNIMRNVRRLRLRSRIIWLRMLLLVLVCLLLMRLRIIIRVLLLVLFCCMCGFGRLRLVAMTRFGGCRLKSHRSVSFVLLRLNRYRCIFRLWCRRVRILLVRSVNLWLNLVRYRLVTCWILITRGLNLAVVGLPVRLGLIRLLGMKTRAIRRTRRACRWIRNVSTWSRI